MSRIVEAFAPARLGTSFRWLLASSWASNLGDGLELAAAPLLVASLTRDPRLVALATLLQRLPWLVFGLPAGVLADRLDRRLVVAVVDLTRAVMLGLLALSVLTHNATVALVLVAMFLLGIAEVFADSASATLTPMLVPRADLALANGRIYAGFATVNQLVGPPVGAALFALAMPAPFAAQAALVAVGAVLILRVRLARADSADVDSVDADPDADDAAAGKVERPRVRHDIADGFRWTVHHPAVRTLTLTIFIFNITFGAAWSILVLYAKERLGMGSVGFGLLTTSAAIGGLVGTTSYGWITRRVSLGDLMKVGLVIETLTHLALALTTSPVLALGIFFVFGAHAFIWGTTSVTVRQRAVPQALQGRVGAVNGLGVYGGLVVGAALGGLIAGRWGITAPFWFAFVGSAVFVVAIWSQLRYIAHDDEPPPGTPPPAAPPAELWPAPVIDG